MHTCRGADAGSDHYLVMSMLTLCLRKAPTKKNRPRKYNIHRLNQDEVLKAFCVEIKNQIQLLSTEEIYHTQSTQNAQYGIQWTFSSQLEDLDYAYDIALLSTAANLLLKKTQLLTANAKTTGLQINQKKD